MPRYWQQARGGEPARPAGAAGGRATSDLTPGEPLTFTATVEIRPEIELGDVRDFDLPEMSTVVDSR